MTLEEKLAMYGEKQRFVEAISGVFKTTNHNSSVEGVSYEAYQKPICDVIDFREWVVVYYTGGGKAMKIVSGSSCVSIFTVIGSMLQGGCYEQVRFYEDQLEQGYEKVIL